MLGTLLRSFRNQSNDDMLHVHEGCLKIAHQAIHDCDVAAEILSLSRVKPFETCLFQTLTLSSRLSLTPNAFVMEVAGPVQLPASVLK